MPYNTIEKRRAYQQRIKESRKEYMSQYNKRYRELHREELNISLKRWQEENKHRTKGYVLKRRYGVSEDEYNRIFNEQGGRCGICNLHQSEFSKALHLDHCHNSKKIRGLLCVNCNTALGHFNESPYLLKLAIDSGRDYLDHRCKKGMGKFNNDVQLLKRAFDYLVNQYTKQAA